MGNSNQVGPHDATATNSLMQLVTHSDQKSCEILAVHDFIAFMTPTRHPFMGIMVGRIDLCMYTW